MARAKSTPGTKANRTKTNSNPIQESAVIPGTGNEPVGQKAANNSATLNTGNNNDSGNNKDQAVQSHSAASRRVPAQDVVVVASGTTPAEAVAETNAAPASKVEKMASSEPAAKPSVESKAVPEPRKLEVVKTDSRKNTVVPINLEDEIRRRAYELYVQRGSIGGSEAEDWLRAEREIRQRYQKQQSA